MKTNSQQKFPVSFQVQIKTVSTSYTVQVVSIDLIHVLLKHFHNCSSNHGCYLMHLRNQDQHSQTGGVYMLSLSFNPLSNNSLNTKFHRAFSAMTVPISLSLSTPVPTLPGKTTMLQASVSRSPVQTSVKPQFLHTTEPQVFNYSRLISHCGNPILS